MSSQDLNTRNNFARPYSTDRKVEVSLLAGPAALRHCHLEGRAVVIDVEQLAGGDAVGADDGEGRHDGGFSACAREDAWVTWGAAAQLADRGAVVAEV